MKRQLALRPIVLVHPDADESDYLVSRLRAAAVDRPIVRLRSLADASDYIETAALAADERFAPCAILLDEKLGEPAVRKFTRWVRSIDRSQSVTLVTLSSDERNTGRTWGADQNVSANAAIESLLGVLMRTCQ